ncbi:MAG: hypothetical protein KKC37_14880, partial [Proteobacteria bacterium]|nr:hypothetical protein [Pseudomonadota bacterium]
LYKICADDYKHGVNYLVVSEAGRKLEPTKYACIFKRLRRILDVSMDQVRSLRARSIGRLLEHDIGEGALFQIGNTAKYILTKAEYPEKQREELIKGALSEKQAQKVAGFKNTLKRISDQQFDLMCRHGWEVADFTLIGYYRSWFEHKPYPGGVK